MIRLPLALLLLTSLAACAGSSLIPGPF